MSIFKKIKKLFAPIEERKNEYRNRKEFNKKEKIRMNRNHKKHWLDGLTKEIHKKRKDRPFSTKKQIVEKIDKIESEMKYIIIPLLEEMNKKLCNNEAEIDFTWEDIISPDDMSLVELKDEIKSGGYVCGWDFMWDEDEKKLSVLISLDEKYYPEINILTTDDFIGTISFPINVEKLKECLIIAFKPGEEKESEI